MQGGGGGGGNCPLQRGFVAVLPNPGDARGTATGDRPGPGRRRRSAPRIFTPCRAVPCRVISPQSVNLEHAEGGIGFGVSTIPRIGVSVVVEVDGDDIIRGSITRCFERVECGSPNLVRSGSGSFQRLDLLFSASLLRRPTDSSG